MAACVRQIPPFHRQPELGMREIPLRLRPALHHMRPEGAPQCREGEFVPVGVGKVSGSAPGSPTRASRRG